MQLRPIDPVAKRRRMMLFANNGGSGLRQALLDGAPFLAELTHSLIPTRGSLTPSFTRATTATGQKWDEAGYLNFTALAGEMVFKGARREYNQWTTSSVTLASGGNKSLTLTAGTYQFSMGAGTGTATFSGTGGATGTLGASASGRVSVAKTITAGTFVVTASVADLTDLQVCNITGETDQTTIRPYVSVGVPSDWAGTDLVTNGTFDTDTTGWTAVNSTLSIVSGKLRVTNVGANAGYCHQAITTVVGQKYVLSATVTQQTSATYSIYIGNGPGSGALGGLGTAASVEFTATATTTYLSTINTQAVDGRYTDFDNISVKPPAYHGSMVDGVKCYDTDRSGNPISTSGSYPLVGYVPWPARTNLLTYSQDFDNAAWTKGGASITANATAAPDGTLTADKVITTSVVSSVYQATTGTLQSVYAKQAELTWVAIVDAPGAAGAAWFNLATGVVGVVQSGYTADIEQAAEGFYRCSVRKNDGAAFVFAQYFPVDGDGSLAVDGSGTKGIYLWGGQSETGSFATPYIPTTTVAVARNADLLTYTGADVALLKTLACTFSRGVGVSSSGVILSLDDGGATNWSLAYLSTPTNVQFSGNSGAGGQWVINSNTYTPGSDSKIAWSQAANDIKADKDGAALTPDTSATPATIDRLSVGHYASGQLVLNGPVNHIYGWTRNLSQSELGAVDRA